MKICLTAVILGFTALSSFGQQKFFRLSNPLAVDRPNELVVLSRTWLQKKLPELKPADFVIIQNNGRPILVQYDDVNGDGIWDEAVFLQDVAPKQTITYSIGTASRPATIKAVVRAHVRQQRLMQPKEFGPELMRDTMPFNNRPTNFSKDPLPPFLTEGPAWENDLVGFRKYFDIRNANDIWGKRVSQMVLDKVGMPGTPNYHQLADWGMDILKVGKSLGAGGLALQIKTQNLDTLIRFGNQVKYQIYERVANGPIRAMYRMIYKDWQYLPGEAPITVMEEISIWGGQYFYENKVSFSRVPAGASLVTGTVDFFSERSYPLLLSGVKGLYSFDKQSEHKDYLGLAILTPSNIFKGMDRITSVHTDVTNIFSLSMDIKENKPSVYRFYAGWEISNPIFKQRQGFDAFIKKEGAKWAKPLILQ